MTVEHPQVIKARLSMIATDAMDCIADLQCQVSDLRTERDELADRVDSLRRQLGVEIRAKDEWEQNAEYAQAERDAVRAAFLAGEFPPNHVPRVITAAELREGQAAVVQLANGEWFAGVVQGRNRVISDGEIATGPAKGLDGYTIVLLTDAPAKDVCTSTGHVKDRADSLHVTAEDIRNSEPGSTWVDADGDILEWNGEHLRADLHNPLFGHGDMLLSSETWPLTRSTAAPRGTYPKRLTVQDLYAAEVGYKVTWPGGSWLTKGEDGTWMGVRSIDVIALGDDATLTPPEKPELPTEPGAVVLVTGYSGAEMPEPIPCIYDTGHQSFVSTDWAWNFQPDQITGWRKARIVVEDGAG